MAQLFSQAIKKLRLTSAAYDQKHGLTLFAPSHIELKGLEA
jgi:hypothetical protein